MEISLTPRPSTAAPGVRQAPAKSADLFNAAQHPKITFVSDKFSFNGDKVSEVSGQLTLLGKTAPVTLKANQFNCYQSPMLKREVCGGDFEATIDRTQWGMNYGVDWGFARTCAWWCRWSRQAISHAAVKPPATRAAAGGFFRSLK